MAVFDWAESPSSRAELVARVAATPFGDGYVQRAFEGLNPLSENWDLSFDSVDVEIADAIDAFLRPKLGVVAFDWTPPRQSAAKRFICTSFTRTITDRLGEHNLSARFEQVFGV